MLISYITLCLILHKYTFNAYCMVSLSGPVPLVALLSWQDFTYRTACLSLIGFHRAGLGVSIGFIFSTQAHLSSWRCNVVSTKLFLYKTYIHLAD